MRARYSGGLKLNARKYQGGWVQLIWFVVSTLVSMALAPKPPKPKSAALADFDVPTADENRPIPVVFGTVEITGANVLWYGDLSSSRIKKGGIFGKTTVGYRYNLGLHMALCYGPVNSVTRIRVDEREAWAGSITANGTATINAPDLFGGKDREGGMSGTVDVEFGAAAQAANTYLTAKLGAPIPAYRGVLGLVFRNAAGSAGGYIGNTPYAKPWGVTVARTTAGWFGGTAWYPSKIAPVAGTMNPAHIIYEALTNPEWGMGRPGAALDDAGFQAAADTLHTEGFGLRLLWNQQSSIEDFIAEVLNHCAGVLGVNPATGKITLTLIRGGYTVGTLPLFDESTIVSLDSFQRQGWGETVNELTVVYTDPDSLKDTGVTVHDLANIRAQGLVSETVPFPGIYSKTLATAVAMRELQARATPLARIRFTTTRAAWQVLKGGVIRVSWARRNLSQAVFRVLNVRRGVLTDGRIQIEAVEDIFAVTPGTYTDVPTAPAPVAPIAPPAPDDEPGATVLSSNLAGAPGTPADGDSHFVNATAGAAAGAWSGQAGKIATWDADRNGWVFSTPAPGTVVYDAGAAAHITIGGGITTPGTAPWSGGGGGGGYPPQLGHSGI